MNKVGAQPSRPSLQAPSSGFPLPDRHAIAQLWDDLRRVERLPAIDKWLEERFRSNKKYGRRDRQQIRDALFTVFRFAEALLLADRDDLHRPVKDPAPLWTDSVSQMAQHLQPSKTFSKGAPSDVLAGLFKLSWSDVVSRSLELQSAFERSAADSLKTEPLQITDDRSVSTAQSLEAALLRHGVPRTYADALSERTRLSEWSADQLSVFLLQQSSPAPLWLRVNTLRCSPEGLLRDLRIEPGKAHTHSCTTSEASLWGDDRLKIKRTTSLYDTEAFRSGFFEIQDFASQEIGLHAFGNTTAEASRPPRLIWDVCAGAGGKSLQLATLLGNRGAVYCTDIRASALKELQRRARRHGLTNIRSRHWDGRSVPPLPKAVSRNGGYDLVFVDAPCSSSGTWRRNPEARFRLDQKTLESFQDIQVGLLHLVANSVAPGGSLVYATCSWLAAENEDVLTRFLNESAHLSAFQMESQRLHGSPGADADCMFSARLVRRQTVSSSPRRDRVQK